MGAVATPNRRNVARAYRAGAPLPPPDYAKALGGHQAYALRFWSDPGGDRTFIAFAEHGGRVSVASLSNSDLRRMLSARPFTRSHETERDPTAGPRVILDLLTRNMLPSRWRREIEEAL